MLDRRQVDWFSSNDYVVEISDGIALGRNAGSAMVWAGMNGMTSDTLVLIVNTPDRAPDFLLDPPLYQLVFQNSGQVSGQTLAGQNITLIVGTDTTAIESNGRFSHWVPLVEGINPIPVTAVNNENGLSTTKQKTFVYYPFETSGIVGHWSGTTLTRPFSFDIYEALGIYVIDGTLTIDVTMIGGPMIVRDIVIAGLIHPDGTIDASLSKEWGGFTLTGHMEGYFRDSGHSQGTYGFRITRSGWPTVSASAAWTAEKD
ncbi:MAG: hypothetical protein GXO90_10030 [FCB group bacterium]|nr:hypothetical protein [FCB group bacterium]